MAAASLEATLNAYLARDPEVRARLGGLEGRVLGIELVDLGVLMYLMPSAAGVEVACTNDGEPDVVVRGSPLALARLALEPGTGSEVEFMGDVGVAQRFQEILSQVEPDWEEALSRLTGDVAAHQLGGLARGLIGWLGEARRTMEANAGEYLQEERREVPASAEIDHFLQNVDELRSDVDRVEARIRRLDSHLRRVAE